MKVTVYEVGPRDGLQYLDDIVPTRDKIKLIEMLYDSGLTEIEEVSFAHPKLLPQMADAEAVFTGIGAGLVMNQRGFERADSCGVVQVNVVISPCEIFNLKNTGKTRSELMTMYKTMLANHPKQFVRVYISMAFGSPYSGQFSAREIRNCVRDARMLGGTVVFADTVGVGTPDDVKMMADIAKDAGIRPALHLHHKGEDEKAIRLVQAGLMAGITEFDSSIAGLGGCPFADGSGANLSTSTLVRHLHAWGFETGVDEKKLIAAEKFVNYFSRDSIPAP